MFFAKKSKTIDPSIDALFSVPTPVIASQTIDDTLVPVSTDGTTIENLQSTDSTTVSTITQQLLSKSTPTRDARKPRHKAEIQQKQEKDAKSLFIGNVPITIQTDKKLLREFKQLFTLYGSIDSIRFRSIALAQPMNRRKGIITKQFHPARPTFNAYIVYKQPPTETPSIIEFSGYHLLVDACTPTPLDMNLCIFIGNLPFAVTEEALYEFFKISGEIHRIRVIRDKKTNVGKGIAYVQYVAKSSVQLAMKLNGGEFMERKVRIERGKEIKKEALVNEASSGFQSKKGVIPNLKKVEKVNKKRK